MKRCYACINEGKDGKIPKRVHTCGKNNENILNSTDPVLPQSEFEAFKRELEKSSTAGMFVVPENENMIMVPNEDQFSRAIDLLRLVVRIPDNLFPYSVLKESIREYLREIKGKQ